MIVECLHHYRDSDPGDCLHCQIMKLIGEYYFDPDRAGEETVIEINSLFDYLAEVVGTLLAAMPPLDPLEDKILGRFRAEISRCKGHHRPQLERLEPFKPIAAEGPPPGTRLN